MTMKAGFAGGVNPELAAAARGGILPRRSLLDDVHDRLIELLLDGDLAPGTRLSIDALARAWEVSPTPIREALVRAEASGLVVRQAMKGYQVAPLLPPEDFAQLMEMRKLLEPYCAERAVERADDDLRATLQRQHDVMVHAPTGPTAREFGDYMRADIAFHETIAEAAGNRFLRTALDTTGTHAHRFRRFTGSGVSDAPDAILEHQRVLDAILAGDAKEASAAMLAHLQGVERRGLGEA